MYSYQLECLFLIGSSNAVNLTDGLDGLAILPSVLIAGAPAIRTDGNIARPSRPSVKFTALDDPIKNKHSS